MNKYLGIGFWNVAIAVALGAFGAHALKTRIDEHYLEIFKTGVSYHLVMSLVLIAICFLMEKHKSAATAFWLVFFGMWIFAASLYMLAITQIGWLGAITPLGGVLMIGGTTWFGLKLSMTKD